MNVSFDIFMGKRQCSMLRYHIFSISHWLPASIPQTPCFYRLPLYLYTSSVSHFIVFQSTFLFLASIRFLAANKVIELNLIVHFWNGLASTKEDKRYEFLMCDYSSLHLLSWIFERESQYMRIPHSVLSFFFPFCILGTLFVCCHSIFICIYIWIR